MRRKFIDLNVIVDELIHNEAHLAHLVKLLHGLGFHGAALSVSAPSKLSLLKEAIRRLPKDIELFTRLDITTESTAQLLKLLSKFRRSAEVICVHCVNGRIASLAARDRRVDLISFDPLSHVGFLPSHASLAKEQGQAVLEIPFWSVLGTRNPLVWERVHRWIRIARDYSLPIVLSSGANNIWRLRAPKDMSALLVLLGLTKEEALDSISSIPYRIISRNMHKLQESFVAPGIKVTGRGEPYEIQEKIRGIQNYKPPEP